MTDRERRKNREETYALILLAGGKSSRMGTDKAELLYKGRSFVENLLEKAKALGISHIFLSGHAKAPAYVKIVWDHYPQRGPLGGIHACLREIPTPYALVLPVDVPQIPENLLEQLLTAHEALQEKKELPFLVMHGERRENLMGVYPAAMETVIEERIREGPASVHGMLRDYGAGWMEVQVPEWQVENINTREAYESLLEMSKEEA